MMPRGMRALREMQPMHLSARSEAMVAYIPVADWMPCMCWCESAIVAVDQSLIGVTTFSCGRPQCQPDDGTQSPVGMTPSQLWLYGVQPVDSAAQGNVPVFVRGPVRIVLRKLLAARRDAAEAHGRLLGWSIAIRRNLVVQAWREGKRPVDIALRVQCDLVTVLDDMAYLRAQGKLGPKEATR